MNASVIHSLDCSAEPLIDWFSAETVINTTYEADYFNNPFDMMEFKAAHMDAFDLVSNQTSLRGDESCSSILTTSWKLEIGPTMKSFSLTGTLDTSICVLFFYFFRFYASRVILYSIYVQTYFYLN